MTQLQRCMQGLLNELKRRENKIRRVAYLTAVKFSPLVDNRFTVTGYWTIKGGGEHAVHFSPEDALIPSGKALKKTPCKFADDVIRGILNARGIGC